MCPMRSYIGRLKQKIGSVLLGDMEVCQVLGLGKVTFKISDGRKLILHGVRYVPKVNKNFFFF